MTTEENKVAARVLTKEGYSTRQIEEWIGISDTTVLRAIQGSTPEELKQFEAEFEIKIKDMKRTSIALVQKRLLELIPKERRIDQIVKAGEYLEGKNNTSVAVQVNNIIPDEQLDRIIS